MGGELVQSMQQGHLLRCGVHLTCPTDRHPHTPSGWDIRYTIARSSEEATVTTGIVVTLYPFLTFALAVFRVAARGREGGVKLQRNF